MSPVPGSIGSGDAGRPPRRPHEERVVFVGGTVDHELASSVTAQLLLLERGDPEGSIGLCIASLGGSLSAVLAIHDVMRSLRAPVTIALGMAADGAAILLASGAPGMRIALRHSQVLVRLSRMEMGTSEPGPSVTSSPGWGRPVVGILARHCGRPPEHVEREERNLLLTADEARGWGLVDAVVLDRAAAWRRAPAGPAGRPDGRSWSRWRFQPSRGPGRKANPERVSFGRQ